ncbi:MAG: type II toxin-antitoxin system RelE/ParE family toxin [Spirochaetales bacterium]|uniref:Type II toxin-antitoxin system RelE/ParE family toxin n=1 Tax=Candidatus Thalassospirochaeta sargassi TaxID=3119039 RepID=A0AAJ1MP07_9SPIO|nr:type II toxin-antitoxin system RelE/ParE family toxin [Spirochaetales bacterium]
MDKYKIAETEQFQKKIKKNKYKNLYKKITEYIYPLLRKNPYFGPNIKRLKGEYSGLYRYRIGKFRLFYEIDNDKIIVFIIDIEDRKDAYN